MQQKQDLQEGRQIIHKAFRYRLQPTAEQDLKFKQFAGCCRFVYNWGLARWNDLYAQGKKTTVFDLCGDLVLLKKSGDHEWLRACHAQILQQSLANLGEAFKNFFEKKSDYPQFKKKGQRDSFRFPQQFEILNRYIKLPKIGLIKYKQDRSIEGKAKSITIRRRGEHWYASVLCEIEIDKQYNESKTCVGVDVGVKHFATTFDGNISHHQSHQSSLQKEINKLKKLHQRLSHKQKGSKNRNKARQCLAKQYERVSNIRQDTLHKLTTALCKNHAAVAVEDLKIRNMAKSSSGTKVAQKRGLSRSIMQQGWGTLFRQLLYKTKWYGSLFVIVDAKRTSQTCPACGFVAKENRLTQSAFKCLDCGYHQNADIVAAMNIRRRGMSCFGQ